MKLIVGLGNPGKKYEKTRHNTGFLVIDALIRSDRNKLAAGTGPLQVNQSPFQNGEAVVAKPTVFMNESGQAVRALIEQFHVLPTECLVVVDDVNLPLGKIRFRAQGSAGGQHGLESIIEALGTQDFPRLRIGIGSGDFAGCDLTEYVLGKFSKEERELLLPQLERAREACLEWVKNGSFAMAQRYNN
ncbi:MAG: aminoacyl-tRNA hydrolase [Omnitrophica bacterium RIFCSPHIGHO2_02_FULL_46_11]|nr:MAG: aminoacyl-tRNA hydrolase [Omnitrophica bacterium RIFCSPHIGHO2_02_FULL_46_11]OGW87907.1 MAG: aminoacyl-tRNA hydrolase [Omnitrophica bacterium RIFCSPLOWO2_01_FULL_45_10b]